MTQVSVVDGAPRVERLAYDVATAASTGGPCRSVLYVAMHEDPARRGGLPFLKSFTVGRRRFIWADDLRKWLETLRAATLTVDLANGNADHMAAAPTARDALEHTGNPRPRRALRSAGGP